MDNIEKPHKGGNYLIPIFVCFFAIAAFLLVMNFAITAPEKAATKKTNTKVNTNTAANHNTNTKTNSNTK